ncbi:hypothetical protein SDC9_184797 [bioreactor metagenome]|uniref:Uncharacterized protein n=1 Tax=bioreactor metagenome TaxID=1076179 RepID=A0A645HE42_9ZZZZ
MVRIGIVIHENQIMDCVIGHLHDILNHCFGIAGDIDDLFCLKLQEVLECFGVDSASGGIYHDQIGGFG